MKDNKLIAEFMGLENPFNEINDATLYKYKGVDEKGEFQFNIELHEMKYHTSWDWLMPVVEECLATDERTEFQHHFINDALLTCDIEVVHDRVVEFIKDCEKKSLIDSLDS